MKKLLFILSLFISAFSFGQNTHINANRAGTIFYADDYGLKNDSTTDNTAQLKSFISWTATVAPKGVHLIFGGGIYFFSDSVIIPSNWRIEGISGTGSSFFSAEASNSTVIMSRSATKSVWILGPATPGNNFTNTANVIEHLSFVNRASSTPTNGAGLRVYDGGEFNLTDVSFNGFWIDCDIRAGIYFNIDKCNFNAPVRVGLWLSNTICVDCGDMNISNTNFNSGQITTSAYGLYWEGGGGLKMVNCKFNNGGDATFAHHFIHGIYLNLTQASGTSDIQLANVSIENMDSCGIFGRFSQPFRQFQMSNVQVGGNNSLAPAFDLKYSSLTTGNGYFIFTNVTINDYGTPHADYGFKLENIDVVNISGLQVKNYTGGQVSFTNCTNTTVDYNIPTGGVSVINPQGHELDITSNWSGATFLKVSNSSSCATCQAYVLLASDATNYQFGANSTLSSIYGVLGPNTPYIYTSNTKLSIGIDNVAGEIDFGLGASIPLTYKMLIASFGPAVTVTNDLGTSSIQWKNLFVQNVLATGAQSNGHVNVSGTGTYSALGTDYTIEFTGTTATLAYPTLNLVNGRHLVILNYGSGALTIPSTKTGNASTITTLASNGILDVEYDLVNTTWVKTN